MINMILSEDIKNKIKDILGSKDFSDLYDGLDDKTKNELGMVYTPAEICIDMIESFECASLAGKMILDPTCGSGNLLIACLIAGANPDKIFGNEYNEIAVRLCRKRVNRACDILRVDHIKDHQIHRGNALQKRCLEDFSEEYLENYKTEYIDDLGYAQTEDEWSIENERASFKHMKPVSLF